LSQIVESHRLYEGFGETGEFTLARREDDQIVFLLSLRHLDRDKPEAVPFHTDSAEPMERALTGKSGTMIGHNYRGVHVLAAYKPVEFLDLGIVAKIDVPEVRKPFIVLAIESAIFSIILIVVGSFLFIRITSPVLISLQKSKESLSKAQRIAHIGSWEYSIPENRLEWTDETYNIFGILPVEFGGKYEDFLKYVNLDDLEYVKSSIYNALYKNENYDIEFMLVRPDNSKRMVHAQYTLSIASICYLHNNNL